MTDMRHGFTRDRRGVLWLRVEPVGVVVLNDLAQQLRDLVAPSVPDPSVEVDPLAALVGIEAHTPVSDDPAVQRLFPAAYRDDDDASADFRRFTERSLREGKLHRAEVVLGGLARLGAGEGRLSLTAEEAQAWLGTLNDLRLVLASRLGVDDDEGQWRERVASIPESQHLAMLYDWLTWLQDSLLEALTR
ncbi:MAG: DUF2017 family protein [Actinobacteria bacterium]|nr:DUF2017 family protein [Actinomycetota bacterium]